MLSTKSRREMKRGKKCENCGSAFELTLHHDRDPHLPRGKKKDNHVIVLCATCHYEIDFQKMMNCYHKAALKKYYKQNEKRGY